MNAISVPRILSSLPSYGKISVPHFPLLSRYLPNSLVPGSLPLPTTCPLPSGALLLIPQHSPQVSKSLSRPETLASSSSLSYFFLLCVQVIITAPSPPSALLEVCRPFSLSPLARTQPKPSHRHTSLTTRRPSHSLVNKRTLEIPTLFS